MPVRPSAGGGSHFGQPQEEAQSTVSVIGLAQAIVRLWRQPGASSSVPYSPLTISEADIAAARREWGLPKSSLWSERLERERNQTSLKEQSRRSHELEASSPPVPKADAFRTVLSHLDFQVAIPSLMSNKMPRNARRRAIPLTRRTGCWVSSHVDR